jgi:hypothetical protein
MIVVAIVCQLFFSKKNKKKAKKAKNKPELRGVHTDQTRISSPMLGGPLS